MELLKITTSLERYDGISELPDEIQVLMSAAAEARESAYAPYSRFYVGAAVLLENGEIITGNNQENAAYPSGLCAERAAVYYTGANFPHIKISALAISAKARDKENQIPVPPCGSCRQVLAEYEVKQKQPISVYFRGSVGPILKSQSVENLLPFLFTGEFL